MAMGGLWILGLAALAADLTPVEAGEQERSIRNALGMEFVLVPGGQFVMGSPEDEAYRDPDELPHTVVLTKPFYLQDTEVTQGQWKSVMGSNPSSFPRCGDRCPVDRVSWLDAQRFIEGLNQKGKEKYRLPTEAEWEYACRAGTRTAFHWGSEVDCSKAMFNNNTRRGTGLCVPHVKGLGLLNDSPAPVKSYPPNPWGLFDMHGNLWEWCQDWLGPYPAGPVTDPNGPKAGTFRVRRGGSWFKYGTYCRAANRNWAHPASRYRTTGFRLVLEPTP
jgi:formylglycine-generating enzyme required for sulfatase activity